MKVLHIDASLRVQGSLSREMSQWFIDRLSEAKEATVDRLDLVTDIPGHITPRYAEAMYVPHGQHDEKMLVELSLSDLMVDKLIDAELIVIGTPTYNFGIPSHLKSYIDLVVRSGRTFIANETGFHGQLKDKKVVVINSRGLSYHSETDKANDHVTPYLRTILGFIGITDITFIHLDPTFFGAAAAQEAVEKAKQNMVAMIEDL